MEFEVKLVDGRGWWLALYIVGMPVLAVGLLMLLQNTAPFLQAGLGVVLLFGGGCLFWRIEKVIQQLTQFSVLADRITTVNQQTGVAATWLFEEISSFRLNPESKGSATLRLTLQNGKKVKLIAHNAGLTDNSTAQLAAMGHAFDMAWRRFKAL